MNLVEGVSEETPILVRDKITGKIAIRSINIQNVEGNERWMLMYETDDGMAVEKLLGDFLGKQIWTPCGWQDIQGVKRSRYKSGRIVTKVVSDLGIVEMSDNSSIMCCDRSWKRAADLRIGDNLATVFPGFNFNTCFQQNSSVPAESIVKWGEGKRIPDIILNDSFSGTVDFLMEYCKHHNYRTDSLIKSQKLFYMMKKIRPETGILVKCADGNNFWLELVPKSNTGTKYHSVVSLTPDLSTSWIYCIETESGNFQAGVGGLIVKG